MAGRSEYTLVGGTGVKITPLEVSAPGTYTAGESEAYNPVTVTGGGGSGKFAELVDGSITEVTAEDLAGVTTIRDYAFYGCADLQSVTLPEGVTSIGANAFIHCSSLASVTIPEGVTSIGTYAFQGCSSLKSVRIPDSVTSIGNSAFFGCISLASVTIPRNVTSINAYAFYNCISLTSVTCMATTPPTLESSVFNNVPADCAIYVPSASVDAYKAASGWSDRAEYIQAIPA